MCFAVAVCFVSLFCVNGARAATFELTTVELSAGDTFQFMISAQGTFDVDCGDGGTLSGTGVTPGTTTIDHTSNTTIYTYTCTYDSDGPKIIGFDGTADAYNTNYAAIRFNITGGTTDANAAEIKTISGSLGQIFGTVDASVASGQPKFTGTFYGASNMTGTNIADPNNSGMNYALPPTLFDGISGAPAQGMFSNTFWNCSGLTGTIPSTLFGRIYGSPAPSMFSYTFYGCSGLAGSIPDGLFGNLTGSPANSMFSSTFQNCSGLTGSIPSGLFGNLTGSPAANMFNSTFSGCRNLTGTNINDPNNPGMKYAIPAGLFGNFTGSPASYMFSYTFYNCSRLSGSIPSGLFGNLTGSPATSMFNSTFSGCSGLTGSIPSGLFGNLTGSPAQYMFNGTFSGCSRLTRTTTDDPNNPGMKYAIPSGLFGNLSGSPAQYMFSSTFSGCSGLIGSIPSGLFGNLTGSPATNMFNFTFSGCSGLTGSIPSGLFGNLTGSPAQGMFYCTFQNCSGLTGSIPSGLFGNLTGSPAANMFTNTFFGCSGLTGTNTNDPNNPGMKYAVPPGLFGNLTGSPAGGMFYDTFYNCSGLTGSIPSGLFGNLTGSPAANMFHGTFSRCSGLTGKIPSGLFGSISGTPAISMFRETFSGCRGLTGSIPSGLFDGISGTPKIQMFYSTFSGCSGLTGFGDKTYVPGDFLENITTNTSVSNQATSMFSGTQLNNPCPANTYASTRTQFNDAGKPWCSECPSGTTSPAGSTSASQCVVPFTVTYTCGSGVPGTAPTDTNSYTPNSTVHTVESFGTCSKDGYYASGWVCDGTSVTSGGTFTITANTTCVAQWTGNGISLTWDGGGTPATCTYGGTFVPPAPAARTGYVFTGWKVAQPSCFASQVCSLTGSAVNGLTYNESVFTTYGYYSHDGQNKANESTYGLTAGGWAVKDTSGGIVKGIASCNSTMPTIMETIMTAMGNGTMTQEQALAAVYGSCASDAIKPGNTFSSSSSGQYCWCKMNSYTPSGGSACNVASPSWVFFNDLESASGCAGLCASGCAGGVVYTPDFRRALFGVSQ